jgi:hypothetical protein
MDCVQIQVNFLFYVPVETYAEFVSHVVRNSIKILFL